MAQPMEDISSQIQNVQNPSTLTKILTLLENVDAQLRPALPRERRWSRRLEARRQRRLARRTRC